MESLPRRDIEGPTVAAWERALPKVCEYEMHCQGMDDL